MRRRPRSRTNKSFQRSPVYLYTVGIAIAMVSEGTVADAVVIVSDKWVMSKGRCGI